mmetsp:Transcript_34064/g.75519  ORF Transcript_34064/g.75519 Transcript_34064/m.75519 type:complete len:87 (-) Transcript_34064:1375-1635(-)
MAFLPSPPPLQLCSLAQRATQLKMQRDLVHDVSCLMRTTPITTAASCMPAAAAWRYCHLFNSVQISKTQKNDLLIQQLPCSYSCPC